MSLEFLKEVDHLTLGILSKQVVAVLLTDKLDNNEIEGWVERTKRQMRAGILSDDGELVKEIILEVDDKLFDGWGNLLFMTTYNEIYEFGPIDIDSALEDLKKGL